eukprot:scaffold32238_cov153-Amphora_coffeaeformis.AAC.1
MTNDLIPPKRLRGKNPRSPLFGKSVRCLSISKNFTIQKSTPKSQKCGKHLCFAPAEEEVPGGVEPKQS